MLIDESVLRRAERRTTAVTPSTVAVVKSGDQHDSPGGDEVLRTTGIQRRTTQEASYSKTAEAR